MCICRVAELPELRKPADSAGWIFALNNVAQNVEPHCKRNSLIHEIWLHYVSRDVRLFKGTSWYALKWC
ncbi:hypothetical protein NDU88_004966 [Pleurodeles waltl]|uniref:Uncharacterized protein n=1 Tax=Pleurodeles waltl TaxID=8319 RepID=A0AAV7NL29_PLEWA|nr:hypothetical protein NDU88_004966 [Pleurodeles waltl]